MIQSACCRKRGSQCIGGYVQGKDSTCSIPCGVGLAIAEFARAPKPLELSGSIQITGRLIAAPKGLEAFPLTEFRVILLTPAGIGAEALTDEQGRFELIVRSARAVLAKDLTLQKISLGNLLFDAMLDSPEGQNFHLLTMLPQSETK